MPVETYELEWGEACTRVEERKEEERELAVRLTPEICYIDLAFPRRRGAEVDRIFLWFPSRGSRRRGAHFGSLRLKKPDKGKAGEFSAYPSLSTGFSRLSSRRGCTRRAAELLQLREIHFIETIRLTRNFISANKVAFIPHSSFLTVTGSLARRTTWRKSAVSLTRYRFIAKSRRKFRDRNNNVMRSHHARYPIRRA